MFAQPYKSLETDLGQVIIDQTQQKKFVWNTDEIRPECRSLLLSSLKIQKEDGSDRLFFFYERSVLKLKSARLHLVAPQ